MIKNALFAIFTYEIIYWGWLKLESIETKNDTEGKQGHGGTSDNEHGHMLTTSEDEIKSLENELKSVTSK